MYECTVCNKVTDTERMKRVTEADLFGVFRSLARKHPTAAMVVLPGEKATFILKKVRH